MTADTALIEKREELKRRLAAGEYKTLIDVLFTGTSRLIQRFTRLSSPIPAWLITIILSLLTTSIVIAALYFAGELTVAHNAFERLGIEYRLGIVWLMAVNVLFFVDVALFNYYINRIMALWQNDILDSTESVASFERFNDWLEKVRNRRLHLQLTIIGGTLLSLVMGIAIFSQSLFMGYGSIFGLVIICILIASNLYLLWIAILLSARLRRYDLKLFPANPGGSELISRLSGELGILVYIVAISGAVGALTTVFAGGLFQILGIAQVALVWLPLIALFILNQTSLSTIIRRAKWKTLNEIQARVEKLQATENFQDKETMEAINRLMDYHDRVKATRDSALDFRTYLSFINSLLLPLLGFILGNLDLVIKFFSKNP